MSDKICPNCGANITLLSNSQGCSQCPWPEAGTVPFGQAYGALPPDPALVGKTPAELRAMAKPTALGEGAFSDYFPTPDQFAKAGREYQVLTAREKQDIRVERLLECLKLGVPALIILQEMRLITRGALEERGLGDVELPQFSDVDFKEEP